MKSGADGPSNAVISWMLMAVFAAAIVFIIAFAMRLPPDRTITASALAALMVDFSSPHIVMRRIRTEDSILFR
jgi:hypothetical protein